VTTTADHFFPRLNEWFKEINDVRNEDLIEYESQTLIWTSVMLLMMKLESRRQITLGMRADYFHENIKQLSGQNNLEKMPHGDTVDYLFERSRSEEYEIVIQKMMKVLFRARVFEKYRVMGKYHRIAVDGIHLHTFDYKHCEHCLVRTDSKTGVKQWLHYKLQASLVLPTGMCLPMASVWIENEEVYDKQDCELKAFERLMKKLRKMYPRLPMCILLDGLYANEPALQMMEELRMIWMVVFKEGSMSEVYEWTMKYKDRHGSKNKLIEKECEIIELREARSHELRLQREEPQRLQRDKITKTTYTWMNAIPHWDGRERKYNIVTCDEEKDGTMICQYVWLFSDEFKLDEDTVKPTTETGRCRWHIENEGINTQKHGGYNLKHLYSRDEVSMKIWCCLIDIAHIINQLIEEGSLIRKKVYGSIRNISKRMYEHFRYFLYVPPKEKLRIQIRLCWWDTS